MTEAQQSKVRRDAARRSGDVFGGISGLLSALAEGYVELVSESARSAGNIVGDLTDDCSAPVRRRMRDDRAAEATGAAGAKGDESEDCGCSITQETVAGDCVDVVDRAFSRFRDTLAGRDTVKPADEAVASVADDVKDAADEVTKKVAKGPRSTP